MEKVTLTKEMLGEGWEAGEGWQWLRFFAPGLGEDVYLEMTWETDEDAGTFLPCEAWEPRAEAYAVDSDGNDLVRVVVDLAEREAVELLRAPVRDVEQKSLWVGALVGTVRDKLARLRKAGV